ncbi:MAG TPA: hypothetical protein VIJ39_02220 [Solirubrobacteraceae bacterium]
MIDLGVALTWAAISAASVKGLTVLARAAVTGDRENESASLASDASIVLPGLRSIGAPPARRAPMKNLGASTDASPRARARL